MAITGEEVATAIDGIADQWRAERSERQQRRHLERSDFDLLRDAGLLRVGAPEDQGGLWRSVEESTRPTCSLYRALAAADPSVALVSSMHPAVIVFWLIRPDADQPDWEHQRKAVFASAVDGVQWGTITSEPGSGGDISKTKTVATPAEGEPFLPGALYTLRGDKHFGSGSGVTQRMMTTAIPDGEDEPTVFVLDFDGRPWDGTGGLELMAEWDGAGMAATQSHAMRLRDAPAVRFGFDGPLGRVAAAAAPFNAVLFTSVVLGVLDEAVAVARERIAGRSDSLRPYEQVEWTLAERDHWVACQSYEGAVRAIEGGDPAVALHAALRAKHAIAELAESTLLRLTRVLGGGTFSLSSPFSHWFEDVRALGFLRPPWALAHDTLFATSLESKPVPSRPRAGSTADAFSTFES
jgi:alkylation response protein AidB-like acyl-CoA dehydrogenase